MPYTLLPVLTMTPYALQTLALTLTLTFARLDAIRPGVLEVIIGVTALPSPRASQAATTGSTATRMAALGAYCCVYVCTCVCVCVRVCVMRHVS